MMIYKPATAKLINSNELMRKATDEEAGFEAASYNLLATRRDSETRLTLTLNMAAKNVADGRAWGGGERYQK